MAKVCMPFIFNGCRACPKTKFPGIRKLVWKEQSFVQYDEIPSVWISRPPFSDRSPVLKPEPILFKLPFLNNFSQGCGKSVYKSGKRISEKPWYQLLQQDLPALFLFDSLLFPDSQRGVRLRWDRVQAFEAGNCVSCELQKFSNAKIPLFQFSSNGKIAIFLIAFAHRICRQRDCNKDSQVFSYCHSRISDVLSSAWRRFQRQKVPKLGARA